MPESSGSGKVITLFIIVTLAGALFGASITGIATTNTTGWNTSTIAVWGTLTVIIVIALFLVILKAAGVKGI